MDRDNLVSHVIERMALLRRSLLGLMIMVYAPCRVDEKHSIQDQDQVRKQDQSFSCGQLQKDKKAGGE
jgi:hypothetical protein